MTDPAEPTLPGKVDLLTTAVDRATAAVERETAARHRSMRLTVAAMTLGFLVFAALIWVVRQDANHRESDRTAAAVVSCKNANESRQAIEDRMEQLVTQLGNTNAPADPTAAAVRQQLIDQFLVQFRASMPQALKARDCSPQAAVNPAPVQR